MTTPDDDVVILVNPGEKVNPNSIIDMLVVGIKVKEPEAEPVISSKECSCYNTTAAQNLECIDDLLMAILVRLPPKSLFKFRFVSKRWENIITSAYFLNTCYENRITAPVTSRLLAFIQTTPNLHQREPRPHPGPGRCPPPLMNILPVYKPDDKYVVPHVRFEFGFFIASSSLFILTGFHPANTYYVMNLVTRDCVKLTPPPDIFHIPAMALVYLPDEDKKLVPSYKIISAPSVDNDVIPIDIYSSSTGKWTKSILKGADTFMLTSKNPPSAINGVVHWYSSSPDPCLVVLDTKDLIIDGVFNKTGHVVDYSSGNNVRMIMLPNSDEEQVQHKSGNFSITRSRGDELCFGYLNDRRTMRYWMLPKYCEEMQAPAIIPHTKWELIRTIDLQPVINDDITPLLLHRYKKEKLRRHQRDLIKSAWLRLEALIPGNDAIFAVLRLGYDIILYNFWSKSCELVGYYPFNDVTSDDTPEVCYGWYPYVEDPLDLSSYGSMS